MMDALDAGAADFQPEEGCFTVYTDPADFNDVAKALEDKGYKFESAQIENGAAELSEAGKSRGYLQHGKDARYLRRRRRRAKCVAQLGSGLSLKTASVSGNLGRFCVQRHAALLF